MPNIATPTVSVVFAITCQILDYLISDQTFKYRLFILLNFLMKTMCFPTQSTNLSIFTHDNVDEFYEIGHFRKSTCFYMRKISLLRKWLVMCIRGFTDTSAPLPPRPLVTSAPSHLGPNHLGPRHLGPSHFGPTVTSAPSHLGPLSHGLHLFFFFIWIKPDNWEQIGCRR